MSVGRALAKRILVRADGGPRIGMGHVMRGIALAEGLAAEGFEPKLILKGYDIELHGLIKATGIESECLPCDSALEEDLHLTLEYGSRWNAGMVVMDVCHAINFNRPVPFRSHLISLRQHFVTICMTGDSNVDYPADVVVSPYVRSGYRTTECAEGTLLLLGPSYFVFRREFCLYKQVKTRPTGRAKNVLVSIGGADPCELTLKVARALTLLNTQGSHFRFIIGPAYSPGTAECIQNVLSDIAGELDICHGSSDMAAEIQWADLAILGDGLVKYEAALLTTPCVTIGRPDSDEFMNTEFAKAFTSIHLGDGTKISVDDLGAEIERVCHDYDLRQKLANNGQDLVDCSGVRRLADTFRTYSN